MSSNTTASSIEERIDNTIGAIKNKTFNMFFFVADSKNTPVASISYIYQLAHTLSEKGYNVTMLYQIDKELSEKEWDECVANGTDVAPENIARHFFGVKSWMGEKYARLKHLNIAKDEWIVTPSDFLFIPEVFTQLMSETHKQKAPCKRYVILQDFNRLTDFINIGDEWSTYKIYNAICSTPTQSNLIKSVFPYVQTEVLPPYISQEFRDNGEPKKLIVNIVAKNQSDVNRIVKQFYWKYSIYKFISFRDVRNLSRKEFAKALNEAAFTVWVDDDTQFGYTPLEAARCGSIVIGTVPKEMPEWMDNNDEFGCWTYNINNIPDILAKAIGSWMQDEIPSELIANMAKINKKYTYKEWETNVANLIDKITSEHIATLQEIKSNNRTNTTNHE